MCIRDRCTHRPRGLGVRVCYRRATAQPAPYPATFTFRAKQLIVSSRRAVIGWPFPPQKRIRKRVRFYVLVRRVALPFCRRRCYYCDFAVSVVGDAHETSDAVTRGMETYVETLSREIANTPSAPSSRGRRRHHPPLRTIFFGGGTPSLLPPALLRRVLDALRARFGIDADAEISMRCAPAVRAPCRARRPDLDFSVSFGGTAVRARAIASCRIRA